MENLIFCAVKPANNHHIPLNASYDMLAMNASYEQPAFPFTPESDFYTIQRAKN